MEIYISREGEQFGPYTAEEVRDYSAEGALQASDLAWHEGLEEWVTLDLITLECPPTRTPPPPSRIPPASGPLKSLSPWLAQGIPGVAFPDSRFLNGFIIIPTNLNDELTREWAAQLLNRHLATPRITQLSFLEGAIDLAKADGLVAEGEDFVIFGSYDFTLKEFDFLHRIVGAKDQIHKPEDDSLGNARTPYFDLSSPIPQRVQEVTGITSGPLGTRILMVEYVSAYLFPPDMQAILPYIYTGQRSTSAFQRYDDGWRIVGEP